jgi:hypothetical protein
METKRSWQENFLDCSYFLFLCKLAWLDSILRHSGKLCIAISIFVITTEKNEEADFVFPREVLWK